MHQTSTSRDPQLAKLVTRCRCERIIAVDRDKYVVHVSMLPSRPPVPMASVQFETRTFVWHGVVEDGFRIYHEE